MTQPVPPGVPPGDHLLGRVLDGRYRIEALVARGGMATVYRGADLRLDRTVAIKVMHPSFASDPGFVERFEREARAAARLNSPFVVGVHDQGNDQGSTYLIMEYVPGHTVRDVLRSHGAIPPAQALAIIDPVLEALAAAHRAGYIHRDVKPENVLISEDGRVKVTDFGLARAIESAETGKTQGLLLGTVAYLSPEQVEHDRTDARSDVYSAGILLFEMLTGAVPFSGAAPIQVAYKHVHEDVPIPSTMRGGLSPELDEIARRATRRDPSDRFQDADGFLASVREVRATMPAEATWKPSPTDTLVVDRANAVPAHDATAQVEPARAASDSTMIAAPVAVVVQGNQTAVRTHTAPDPIERPAPSAPRPKRGRKGIWVGILALVCLVGVLAFLFGPLQRVAVPNVEGKTVAEATAILATTNLKLNSENTGYSETVKKGEIISTDPGAGQTARTGSAITAVISKGPERYDVPNLAGAKPPEAKVALESRKLVVGTSTEVFHDTIAKGRIVSTAPKDGESVKPGTVVNLNISKGPKPITLPQFEGAPAKDAKDKLKSLGLKVHVTKEISESVPKGNVISMDPKGGVTIPSGSTVDLVESKGPPMVTVPSVVGKSSAEARSILEAAGFQVKAEYPLFVGVLDQVQSQNPKGGSSAPKGSVVTIDVV